jgi:hypothetical protein
VTKSDILVSTGTAALYCCWIGKEAFFLWILVRTTGAVAVAVAVAAAAAGAVNESTVLCVGGGFFFDAALFFLRGIDVTTIEPSGVVFVRDRFGGSLWM